MAMYAYRCCKCRKRTMLKKKLDHLETRKMFHIGRNGKSQLIYAAVKCKYCGHARFYLDKERTRRSIVYQESCSCEGYNHNHRPGSKFCVHNKDYELNVRVHRYGEDRLNVVADMAFENNVVLDPNAPCPF